MSVENEVWSAAGCAVAGAVAGCLLPRISFRFAHGHDGSGVRRTGRGEVKAAHVLLAGAATSAVMAVFGYRHFGPTLVAWCWLTITGVCLAIVDIERQLLPRPLVGAMAAGGLVTFGVVAVLDTRFDSLLAALLAAVVTFGVTMSIALAFPGHLGGGDVTLLPVLALYLGWFDPTTVMLGMVAGVLLTGIHASVLVVLGRASKHTRIAAGPTLILGALVAIALATDVGPR